MDKEDKPLVWLHGAIKTPPFSRSGRLEAGFLLRQLQAGERLTLPHSRPMPGIGARCQELRVNDKSRSWRIIYRLDEDAVVILEVFEKQKRQTPVEVIQACKRRLREYDAWERGG